MAPLSLLSRCILLTSALACGASGCATPLHYGMRVLEPHKDVLLVVVTVPERLEPHAYRAIADRELERILQPREATAIAIYEVHFEFVVARPPADEDRIVARLTWRLENGSPHVTTFLF